MRTIVTVALVLFFVMMAGCGPSSQQKKILPVNTMKLVMWDMMKADEWYAKLTVKDSAAQRRKADVQMYEQVFKVHGIGKEQFYNSYRYYEAHPVAFKVLIDSIDAMAGRERIKRFTNANKK